MTERRRKERWNVIRRKELRSVVWRQKDDEINIGCKINDLLESNKYFRAEKQASFLNVSTQ